MAGLQLELNADDPAVEGLITEIGSDQVLRAKPDHFEGDINIVNLLIQLTTSTIPIVAMLVTQHIRAKRYIKVKVNGIEVRGADLDKIEPFLNKLSSSTEAPAQKPVKNTSAKPNKEKKPSKSKKKR
jgi:hypothetical protein